MSRRRTIAAVSGIYDALVGVVMLAALLMFVVAHAIPSVGWGLPHNVSTFGGAIDAPAATLGNGCSFIAAVSQRQ